MKSKFVSRCVNSMSQGRVKYSWWTSSWQSAAAPVIIGGSARSGTTLMRAMLNAHRKIAIGPETGLFCGGRDFAQLARTLQEPIETVRRDYQMSACLGEFIERLMQRGVTRAAKCRWGEKSPCNVRSLERVFQFFPNARFIHMIRDGRDVVSSLRTHPKYKWQDGNRVPTGICNPWPDCVAQWVFDTNAGLRWRGEPRYREARYEDLVRDPETVLRELLAWMGEEWDPNVLSFHRQHEERCSDVANPGVKQAVYQDAVSRWKKTLPAEARAHFTPEARELLVLLQYATDDAWMDEYDTRDNNEHVASGATVGS
jgi:hypothetical protein